MKATTLLGLFAFAGIALSAALEPIITRDVDGDLPPMTWTGPTKVGGEEVTLHGTVQEIYAQLTAINPQYNALDFPEYRKKVEEVAVLQGLTPEEFVNGNSTSSSSLQKRDWMNCDVAGDMVLYSGFSCKEGKDYLVRLGNGLCGAPPGPGGCHSSMNSHQGHVISHVLAVPV
ncbi:uncharacterized protein CTRU02_207742 [Colletotrichum truncatum]|uniref:Secreted protein n=1 Tax=Colletotrichum truncatum TaxID=5467 RepID=A0ACC3Z1Q2_COLTU|nr:uncharacterized protein CTRU02_09154 [Colletotrichum truncatum]KAF6788833.1 secreted protein [Colletotrichum truncatum]